MPFVVDGDVRLFYQRVVGPKSPIMFLHGWCCDHTYLQPQFDHFADLGHEVVAVDFRGHGQSDKPISHYSMQLFADDVIAVARHLQLRPPVIVGHSMGGIVAFELAKRSATLPAAIVMLDSAVAIPSASRPGIEPFLSGLRGPGYRHVLADYVRNALFISTDDRQRRSEIPDAMAKTPQHVLVSAFEGLRDYDPETGGRVRVPGLYIDADEPTPRSDTARMRDLAPELLFGKTVASGHFCQLEVPDQINAMIARFIEVTVSA